MNKEYAKSLLKKTTEDYNLIAGQFSSTRRFIWEDLKPLAHYTIPGERVLDLGCGNGRLLQIFKNVAVDYFGIDSSEKLIEIAREKYPEDRFRVADAFNLSFPDNYFDKVYSIAVFHHIPSKELRLQFLKETKRVLKPRGLFIITVWNLNQLRSMRLILKYTILKIFGLSKLDLGDVLVPWGKTCQRYIHNFTQASLKKIVKKADFTIKEVGILKRPEMKDSNIYLVAKKQ